MAGERKALQDPLTLDLSMYATPPLRFVVQPPYEPQGIVEQVADGLHVTHTPWFDEARLDLIGSDEVFVVYLLPLDDTTMLQAACLEDAFEPAYRLATGGDFGDPVSRLMAKHWPDVHAMVVDAKNQAPERRWLMRIRTPGREQWVVADQLRGAQREALDHERTLNLLRAALVIVHRSLNFHLELPGVLEVLGGPDLLSRRLSSLADMANAAGGIADGMSGGVQESELRDLLQNAYEFLRSVRSMKA